MDDCGICNGNNTSCIKITGRFEKSINQSGKHKLSAVKKLIFHQKTTSLSFFEGNSVDGHILSTMELNYQLLKIFRTFKFKFNLAYEFSICIHIKAITKLSAFQEVLGTWRSERSLVVRTVTLQLKKEQLLLRKQKLLNFPSFVSALFVLCLSFDPLFHFLVIT